jgi:predicted RNase H-like nuclease (RuvC/YqgF family)
MAERFGRSLDPNPASAAGGEEDDLVQSSAPIRPGGERLDSQVQKAQEQLLNLKRQQELIEKQKRELEELSRRQEELEEGRAEMVEKLTRSLTVLERQTTEAHKRVEQLRATTDSFTTHLRSLESINPKTWPSAEMQRELARALSMVDHARTEYNQQRGRFAAEAAEGGAAAEAAAGETYEEMFGGGSDHSFLYWLKAGLAFTLPLLLLGLVAIFIFCWRIFSTM